MRTGNDRGIWACLRGGRPAVQKGSAPSRRWVVQLIATLASNPHLSGLATGTIYKGGIKHLCVPGLNCYSCPAAVGACPVGALQATIGSSRFSFAAYATGFLVFTGVLLGRVVCSFLCPFGWFQEIVHKIPSKKLATHGLRALRWLKYAILVAFVLILPATVVNEVGMGDPWFCKWLCPVGILEGALPLAAVSSGIRSALGTLFTWKSCLLLGLFALAVFFYRPFCKWLCPLGALYGILNRVSLYRIEVDRAGCVSCGRCTRACKMDVPMPETPNGAECIRCGDCARTCPRGAISAGFRLAAHPSPQEGAPEPKPIFFNPHQGRGGKTRCRRRGNRPRQSGPTDRRPL